MDRLNSFGTSVEKKEMKKISQQIELGCKLDEADSSTLRGRPSSQSHSSSSNKKKPEENKESEVVHEWRTTIHRSYIETPSSLLGSHVRITTWDWFPPSMNLAGYIFGKDGPKYGNTIVRLSIPRPEIFSYICYEDRLESFQKRWPKQMAQDPETMARAGFFYTTHGDICNTFCCNLLLHHWNHYDNPLEEHKKYSPSCGYPQLAGK